MAHICLQQHDRSIATARPQHHTSAIRRGKQQYHELSGIATPHRADTHPAPYQEITSSLANVFKTGEYLQTPHFHHN